MTIVQPELGARIWASEDMAAVDLVEVAGGVAAVHSSRAPDKDGPNEDAAAVLPAGGAGGVLVLADGCGGYRHGEVASRLAVEALRDSVASQATEPAGDAGLRAAILDAFEAAHERIAATGTGAATTLAVVEVQDGTVRAYHAGDSIVLLTGQRGKVKLRTVAHSPVAYAVESGLLDEQDAMVHEDRSLVDNVLGAPGLRLDVGSTLPLQPRDTLLLASDGVSDNLSTDEIVEVIRKGALERAARTLLARCRERMLDPAAHEPSAPDDLTFILFRRHA